MSLNLSKYIPGLGKLCKLVNKTNGVGLDLVKEIKQKTETPTIDRRRYGAIWRAFNHILIEDLTSTMKLVVRIMDQAPCKEYNIAINEISANFPEVAYFNAEAKTPMGYDITSSQKNLDLSKALSVLRPGQNYFVRIVRYSNENWDHQATYFVLIVSAPVEEVVLAEEAEDAIKCGHKHCLDDAKCDDCGLCGQHCNCAHSDMCDTRGCPNARHCMKCDKCESCCICELCVINHCMELYQCKNCGCCYEHCHCEEAKSCAHHNCICAPGCNDCGCCIDHCGCDTDCCKVKGCSSDAVCDKCDRCSGHCECKFCVINHCVEYGTCEECGCCEHHCVCAPETTVPAAVIEALMTAVPEPMKPSITVASFGAPITTDQMDKIKRDEEEKIHRCKTHQEHIQETKVFGAPNPPVELFKDKEKPVEKEIFGASNPPINYIKEYFTKKESEQLARNAAQCPPKETFGAGMPDSLLAVRPQYIKCDHCGESDSVIGYQSNITGKHFCRKCVYG